MFQQIEGNGRIWIYAANRTISIDEAAFIKSKFDVFCSNWKAHGKNLSAEFKIAYNQILILAVNEDLESATGCSIDTATALFREIDATYKLDLFNRMNLTFLKGDQVQLVMMTDLNQAYLSGFINDNTTFLDNSIGTLLDFRNRWQIPFNKSWLYRKVKKLAQTS